MPGALQFNSDKVAAFDREIKISEGEPNSGTVDDSRNSLLSRFGAAEEWRFGGLLGQPEYRKASQRQRLGRSLH
jgi:hypothetical protein